MTTLHDEEATHEVNPSTAPASETSPAVPAPKPQEGAVANVPADQPRVVEEVVIEEVGVDGMCGVY